MHNLTLGTITDSQYNLQQRTIACEYLYIWFVAHVVNCDLLGQWFIIIRWSDNSSDSTVSNPPSRFPPTGSSGVTVIANAIEGYDKRYAKHE